MSTTTLLKPPPGTEPIPTTSETPLFTPSVELGDQLQHLEQVQVEIDRRRVAELARLRAIQDRD